MAFLRRVRVTQFHVYCRLPETNRKLDNSEFCDLPMTPGTVFNPFHCTPQKFYGSRLLFHAVMALCYRHLNNMISNWSEEIIKHRGKATQLLEAAMASTKSRNCLHLPEPILILFTLDVSDKDLWVALWFLFLTKISSVLSLLRALD